MDPFNFTRPLILQSTPSNGTAPVLWVPQPKFRGTFGILSLCMSTLLICVWNALHLDIPIRRYTTARKLLVSVSWMIIAIFGPELLLFIAFNQRVAASAVTKQAIKLFSSAQREQNDPQDECVVKSSQEDIKEVPRDLEMDVTSTDGDSKCQRIYPFTIVHGFYASMGGFVFDFLDESGEPHGPSFLPSGQTRMSISSAGVQFLLRHDPDLIPDISEGSITDRSKSSGLSKAILVAQLIWFCANCISRLAQHLPLSLLEVATVAHGLCGMLTYMFWWHKPLGITDPTPIRGKRAREACALMAMCSMKHQYLLGGIMSIHLPAELDHITILPPSDERNVGNHVKLQTLISEPSPSEPATHNKQPTSVGKEHVMLMPEQQGLGALGLTPRQYVSPGVFQELSIAIKARILYRFRTIAWHAQWRKPNQPVILQPDDVNRWLMGSNAMRRYGVDLKALAAEIPSQQPYVQPRSSMQASSDTKAHTPAGILRTNFATIALTVAFGLPHFLGWNVDFPTRVEQRLWRIATVTVTSWGVGMGILAACAISFRWWFRASPWDRRGETAFVACGAVVYNTATGYLLLESIRQLFFLPPTAYELPSWSNYWPHFG